MNSDISVLIIEDEEIWADRISSDLKHLGFKICAVANSVEDALPAITGNNFDIALLDINLHGKNTGIELGRMISQTLNKPIIFITGYFTDGVVSDVIREAAAAHPSAFLTKPVNAVSLFVSIQSALNHFSNSFGQAAKKADKEILYFFVKSGNKYLKVNWDDVVCLRSEKNYISISTINHENFVIRSSLQRALQVIIPESLKKNFVQVNRAEILQARFIKEFNGNEAKANDKSFVISDPYIKNLKQRLNLIL